MGYTLGIDMGTASIGWALLRTDKKGGSLGIEAAGARIFEEVVDLVKRVPKNRSRREARSARRTLARRKMRRQLLSRLLTEYALLPATQKELDGLLRSTDPYELRKKGLDSELESFELGRVLFHLCQRRGFKSNRKAKKKEDGYLLTAISALRARIDESGCRTLGEYLLPLPEKRRTHTERSMYEHEFALIWEKQSAFSEKLTTELKVKIHNAIFHQRPLKIQKHLIGKCTFEPSKKRAPRAILEAQRFRFLQNVNNLKVKDPVTREYRRLNQNERTKLISALEKSKTVGWEKAKKVMGLHEGEVLNLEEGGKDKLLGDSTSYDIRVVLGKAWDEMSPEKKSYLITDMLTIDNEGGFINRMVTHWGFSPDEAAELAMKELEKGHLRISKKALTKILPFMEEGYPYDIACEKAGYNHYNPEGGSESFDKLPSPPELKNPVVTKALHESRKVINAIILRYGKPDIIRLEMARDMKLGRKQKEKLLKEQNQNKKSNDAARIILRDEFGIQKPTHEDILKYKLWQECGMVCPYTGKAISRQMLFSSDVDVEHILPYSRVLDDSFMNKTLCIASENRKVKQNKTPFEAYDGGDKYSAILQRARCLPYKKRLKFEMKKINTDEFVSRQLNDTRYICTEVKCYLAKLGIPVEVTRGGFTATLRRCWRLNGILAPDGADEKYRGDHRHHAVDAIVIALSSRRQLFSISSEASRSNRAPGQRGFVLETPWLTFFSDVSRVINSIIVSHAATRAMTGALHQETAYGYDSKEDVFVCRKPIQALTPKMVEKIRDKFVRELVEKRLGQHGGDIKKAFVEPLYHHDGKTPVKTVRIAERASLESRYPIKDKTGKPYKYFELGNNHHVEILEDPGTGKRRGVYVTVMEAAKRARIDKTAIVQRDHGEVTKFVTSLCANDMLEIKNEDKICYYRVQKMSGPNNKITLREHSVSDSSESGPGVLRVSPNTLRGRKVQVDCLGTVYLNND